MRLTEGQLKEIGNRIRNRRRILNINQDELAAAIGVTQSHLSKVERGLSETPKIVELAAVLDVTPEYLKGVPNARIASDNAVPLSDYIESLHLVLRVLNELGVLTEISPEHIIRIARNLTKSPSTKSVEDRHVAVREALALFIN